MNVPSFAFVGVALLVALLVHLSETRGWRSAVMLAANLAFMGSFAKSPLALVPFAGFLLFGFIAVRLLQAGRRRLFATLVVATLALFFWLKRYGFVPSALLIDAPYVTVGLSYVFFRALHLIIDAGQGALTERVGAIDYLNYTLNFPCIVAGPIQMYPDWRAGQEGRPDVARIAWAAERILLGLFKVSVLSALIDIAQGDARAELLAGESGWAMILAGAEVIALYPVYLYFNFSGYTDVVIGAARLMGLRLPENFDYPFTAPNFIDFWSRWHITLSTWLRTYVYSPFLMSALRRAPGRSSLLTVLAFFLTFFLVGAWHGQTAEFLFFGVLQGGGVAVNKLYQLAMTRRLGRKRWRALGDDALYIAFARGLTFTWFAFTLLWFWSEWTDISRYAAALGWGGVAGALFAIWLAATIALECLAWIVRAARGAPSGAGWPRLMLHAAFAGSMLLMIGLMAALNAPPPPVVYRTF